MPDLRRFLNENGKKTLTNTLTDYIIVYINRAKLSIYQTDNIFDQPRVNVYIGNVYE